jgi:hypothetical protein
MPTVNSLKKCGINSILDYAGMHVIYFLQEILVKNRRRYKVSHSKSPQTLWENKQKNFFFQILIGFSFLLKYEESNICFFRVLLSGELEKRCTFFGKFPRFSLFEEIIK